jgi:hypothetical protein
MRVLFDQSTPVPIRPLLAGHSVRTAAQERWDTLKNGDLLSAAQAAGFDVLLTTDKNIRYQQNLTGRTIAIVVIGRPTYPFSGTRDAFGLEHGGPQIQDRSTERCAGTR